MTTGSNLARAGVGRFVTLHVPRCAKLLEGAFGLLVLCPARAFGRLGVLELGDDVVDSGGGAGHRARAGRAAERAIAQAVAREIEIDHRDALAPDVAPDIELGPMQQRMDAQ